MKVYPVGTVQLIRPRAELGRQSARQVGIAGISLSFCAQGFQRKRCQLFDRLMPTFGPGSFFAAVRSRPPCRTSTTSVAAEPICFVPDSFIVPVPRRLFEAWEPHVSQRCRWRAA